MQSGGQATPRAKDGSAELHGVEMEQHLRTSNSTIYAVGDCCSRYKFTHAAMAMGQLAARNPSTRWPDPYAWLPGRTRHQT